MQLASPTTKWVYVEEIRLEYIGELQYVVIGLSIGLAVHFPNLSIAAP